MRLIDADKIDFNEAFGGQSDFARDTREAAQSLIDSQPDIESWIPVTERLPELHRDVLVAVCDVNEDDASTFIDCLVDNNDRPTWSTYNGALDRVLAWMP